MEIKSDSPKKATPKPTPKHSQKSTNPAKQTPSKKQEASQKSKASPAKKPVDGDTDMAEEPSPELCLEGIKFVVSGIFEKVSREQLEEFIA